MTEFHWRLQLRQLRDMVKKVRVSAAGKVHVVEDIRLPGFVRGVLGLGPKFAVQPQMKKPELLSMVRQVSKRAPEHEATRIISEGVDALNHFVFSPDEVQHIEHLGQLFRRFAEYGLIVNNVNNTS
ncbi:hypothetical protein HPB50_004184 [Hyalomma asiaticum]|uniref:Uncharacterized protein n=1 Tax=Hyalomma asiaticum TaxID=266040 RepID=A0ACB7S173_HYAAI|nr:hypothetical protein HPB50_004184 [Hyalomma asiaticum]